MANQEDKKNDAGNVLLEQFRDNADWQVAAVVLLGLAFVAAKLLLE